MSMERLTHEADFGLEDWEETLFFVKSDPNGAYNILDIAKYQGEDEFDEILKNIALRLSEIENILGDIYDLDRLRELVEADKFGRCTIISTPERLMIYEELEHDIDPDRLRELVEADKDGRCVVLPCKIGETLYRVKRFKRGKNWKKEAVFITSISLNGNNLYRIVFGGELCKTVFLTREAAEAALAKEVKHE